MLIEGIGINTSRDVRVSAAEEVNQCLNVIAGQNERGHGVVHIRLPVSGLGDYLRAKPRGRSHVREELQGRVETFRCVDNMTTSNGE